MLRQHPPRPLRRLAPDERALRHPGPWPSISVVTPSFNQGGFLAATASSILDQGYPNLEYIVQDGASRDGTVAVLQDLAAQGVDVRSEADSGQAQAINRGFSRSHGEIMAWVNSDDLLLPGALHYVGWFFATHPHVEAVYGHRLLIDAVGQEVGRWVVPTHRDAAMPYMDFIPQETLFWRRSLWDRVGGRLDESFQFALDWDLLLRMRRAGAKFERVPRFLGAFRVHQEQKTSAVLATVGAAEGRRLRERELGSQPSRSRLRTWYLVEMLRHKWSDLGRP